MDANDLQTKVVSSMTAQADAASASSSFADSLSAIIDRLGRYVLLDRLGRGAFGTVWAAFDPQLDRKVALKIVHGRRREGTEAQQTRADLLSEAQLLAQLSHPNVVAIHDVGRLEDALGPMSGALLGGDASIDDGATGDLIGVFIVMEHLDGPTLAEWFGAEARPPADEILRVFGEAGRGLQAAHGRGLVHLDFKPSNVMFGADGRVRVLDFGLAEVGRHLRRRSSAPDLTRVAGTPAYMAPEQHEGKQADERADQYAFCVSLWEALHGARPFVAPDARGMLAAKQQGPPKLATIPPGLAHVQAALERGLAFDRDQRFASMQELLAILADDPRLRRRRWAAGAALVAGLLGAGFGLARASDVQVGDPCALPSDQFAGVWDDERRAAVRDAFVGTGASFAEQTFTQIAEDLDDQIARWTSVRGEVCHATLVAAQVPVERMSEQLLCLDRQLRSVAGLSKTLLDADAEIIARARDSVLALDEPEDCQIADDEGEQVVGEDRRLALLSVEDEIAGARVLIELGRFEPGLAAADRAIERATALDDRLGLARAQRERGVVLRELSRFDEAVSVAIDALRNAAHVEARAVETQVLIDLISAHTAAGQFERAAAVSELAVARVDPEREPEQALNAYLYTSIMHERQQHWDAALTALDAAVAVAEAKFPDQPAIHGQIHVNYGNVLVSSGRDIERGGAEYEQAIELMIQAYGPHHPQVAKTRMNLGSVYFRRRDFATAAELLESALEEFQAIYPADHPYIGMIHQNLGAVCTVAGDLDGAIEHTRESLARTGASIGTAHPTYATAERNLGTLLLLTGQHREAQAQFEHAASIYEATYEPGDSRLMAAYSELAEAAWWLGQYDEARAYFGKSEAALAKVEAVDHRRIGPLSTGALLARHDGDLDHALALARELVAFMQATFGDDNHDLARGRAQLAEILRERGEYDEAREQLELARKILEPAEGRPHPYIWPVYLELGRLALAQGRRADAITELEAALAVARGPGGAKVHAAITELELAKAQTDPAAAAKLRAGALAVLEGDEVRPDLYLH